MVTTRSQSLGKMVCNRQGQVFNYDTAACVSKNSSRGKAIAAAQAKAKAALRSSSKSTKDKLKTILKVGAGLGGAALAAYGAYLMSQPRFKSLVRSAASAVKGKKIPIATSQVNAKDTTKSLLGKVTAMLGKVGKIGAVAGATGLAGYAGHKAYKKNPERVKTGLRGIGSMVMAVPGTLGSTLQGAYQKLPSFSTIRSSLPTFKFGRRSA